MTHTIIESSEFLNRVGHYMDQAADSPVLITQNHGSKRVLINVIEYNRLKANDTRIAYWSDELPSDVIEALENAKF